MRVSTLEKIVAEEYAAFYANCEKECLDRHNGDKVAMLSEMQGFDYPDYIATGLDIENLAVDNGITVPKQAIGLQVLNSVPGFGDWILSTDTEQQARQKCRELYY